MKTVILLLDKQKILKSLRVEPAAWSLSMLSPGALLRAGWRGTSMPRAPSPPPRHLPRQPSSHNPSGVDEDGDHPGPRKQKKHTKKHALIAFGFVPQLVGPLINVATVFDFKDWDPSCVSHLQSQSRNLVDHFPYSQCPWVQQEFSSALLRPKWLLHVWTFSIGRPCHQALTHVNL